MRTRTFDFLLAAAAMMFTALACIPLDDFGAAGGSTPWEPVDEDYARSSPALTIDSALQRRCDETTNDAPDMTPQLQVKEAVFGQAMCLCGDFDNVGSGLVTRSASTLLGSDGGRGTVGVNGQVDVVGDFVVGGSLDVARGLHGVGDVTVAEDLVTGGNVQITGTWEVGRDAWIEGDLDGVGTVTVDRDLYLGGDLSVVGDANFQRGHRGFTYMGDPCGCDAGSIIDVAAEVRRHQTENDNGVLPSGVGTSNVVLDSGSYYFSGESSLVGSGTLTIRGHVELYVEGDIRSVGELSLDMEPGSELELWVSGTIESVGNLTLAPDDERPRAFRLFMGGAGSAIMSVGDAAFVGAIYAPRANIEYVGDITVKGSLFANTIKGTGSITVEYDTDIAVPQACADREYKL